jgi:MFS family permease
VTTPALRRAGWVLTALIAVELVANMNLAVANVALPDIGDNLHASQAQLNLVAVGFSAGLAGTVLYLGAIGDRYGRKALMLTGLILSLPSSLAAAWAPNVGALIVARVIDGVAAGMAYPTTLALITALFAGAARTRAIALWSAFGGAAVAIASLIAGILLAHFWWGSVFLVAPPVAIIALALSAAVVPAHVHESTDPVDHFGGALSVVAVVALILAINDAADPQLRSQALVVGVIAVLATAAFLFVQHRGRHPLFDLTIASRRLFWVAATAGIIVFGALMGAIFIGQQFMQNVLGLSTVDAGIAVMPAAATMILVAPQSAKLIARYGSRVTLLVGYAFALAGFLSMLAWTSSTGMPLVCVTFAVLGIGVGLAGTPASHAITGSVPVTRAGMASGTCDLQRDLGGASMQSILGVLLTAGYAAAVTSHLAHASTSVTQTTRDELTQSFGGALAIAHQYPQYSAAIIAGAKESFQHGADAAYLAGAIAVVAGMVLVATLFPGRTGESRLLSDYAAADA